MIDITLIGTSALLPIPERALTSVFLSCGGHSILFDCGEGTQSAARKAGISLIRTDIIALTHYHGDHIFGLPGLLQTMNCMGRTEKLYITGPSGINEELAPILKLAGWLPYEIELIELNENGLKLSELCKGWNEGAELHTFPTEHRVSSQGYVFLLKRAGKFNPEKARALEIPQNQWGKLQKGESVEIGERVILPEEVLGEQRKGIKFVFTGDTMPCQALLNAAENADLLISEATYGENEQEDTAIEHGHMTFALAANTAFQANVKKLWLSHYSQMIENPEDYLENALKIFEQTECGYDGKKITLNFSE